jgi:phosphoglycolate phosphatase-like HAD superfamily hydrolase
VVKTLLLFDIDGTLVLTGGAGIRGMLLAFEEVFGTPARADEISMAGRTDAWVVEALAAAHAVSPSESDVRQFRDAYLRHLPVEIQKPGPRKGIMPGIRALLDALAVRPDAHLALLTGNYERSARAKLEYFDLWRYFVGGAFGDHAVDRNQLFHQARQSVVAHGGPDVAASRTIVVGDTPYDIACAQYGGGRSIGVATGGHSSDELRAAGADSVFEDLSDTPTVIAEIERLAAAE